MARLDRFTRCSRRRSGRLDGAGPRPASWTSIGVERVRHRGVGQRPGRQPGVLRTAGEEQTGGHSVDLVLQLAAQAHAAGRAASPSRTIRSHAAGVGRVDHGGRGWRPRSSRPRAGRHGGAASDGEPHRGAGVGGRRCTAGLAGSASRAAGSCWLVTSVGHAGPADDRGTVHRSARRCLSTPVSMALVRCIASAGDARSAERHRRALRRFATQVGGASRVSVAHSNAAIMAVVATATLSPPAPSTDRQPSQHGLGRNHRVAGQRADVLRRPLRHVLHAPRVAAEMWAAEPGKLNIPFSLVNTIVLVLSLRHLPDGRVRRRAAPAGAHRRAAATCAAGACTSGST